MTPCPQDWEKVTILGSVAFGVWGFAAFAVEHWLCNFTGTSTLSPASFKGGQILGRGFEKKAVFVVCGALLLSFGGKLIVEGAVRLLA